MYTFFNNYINLIYLSMIILIFFSFKSNKISTQRKIPLIFFTLIMIPLSYLTFIGDGEPVKAEVVKIESCFKQGCIVSVSSNNKIFNNVFSNYTSVGEKCLLVKKHKIWAIIQNRKYDCDSNDFKIFH